MTVITTDHTYICGELSLTRLPGDSGAIADSHRFRMEGNWAAGRIGSDHMQLIYEALEIAAHSDDKFKLVFAAFRDEVMALNQDWCD